MRSRKFGGNLITRLAFSSFFLLVFEREAKNGAGIFSLSGGDNLGREEKIEAKGILLESANEKDPPSTLFRAVFFRLFPGKKRVFRCLEDLFSS